jgi:amino acid adenylation domain-containing protein
VPRDGELPLSFAQQRLWFTEQLNPGKPVFNLPCLYRLRGSVNIPALEQALNELVRRHETLRTTFHSRAGRPVQVIAAPSPVRLPVEDYRALGPAEAEARARAFVEAEAARPFDLAAGPLFRVYLLRLTDDDSLLLYNLHHTVFDGWSVGVLNRELSALASAFAVGKPAPLPAPAVQYADYAAWQRQWLSGAALEERLAFWKRQLDGVPTLLELPCDRPRPRVQTHRGARRRFTLPAELAAGLKDLGRREGATLFMTLMAAFQAVLYRHAGQERFLVSTGVANRDRPETEALIGCLINILLLRADLSRNPRFRELVGRVKDTALASYAHQDTPFEKIVEAAGGERDLSYHPLAQVMFVLLSAAADPLELPGVRAAAEEVPGVNAECDLVLHMQETAEGLAGYIDYSTDLFDPETIDRLLGHFRTLLAGAAADPDQRVLDLPLLTAAERQRVLYDANATHKDFPADKCLHHLFEQRAAAAPQAPAVLYADACLSYGELDRRANQLARHLRKLGVGPDVLVGLCVERSPEMVVGLLGILKAGGAYVPLDPAYPQERLRFMLEDTHTPVLLTQAHLRHRLAGLPARVVCLDADWPAVAAEEATAPQTGVGPLNLSYVIFTSGSTGTPKGIALAHRGVLNNIVDLNGRFGVGPGDRVLCLSSLSFDMCVYEVFGTLEAGGAIVMPLQAELREPARWAELMRRHRVSVWNSAPALLKMLVDYVADRPDLWPRHLHLSILGGDWVPVTLPDRLEAMAPQVRFIVLGGATEASIHSIIYPVEKTDPTWKSIPYGVPQYNQKAYVLNARLEPAPVGVAGELYLGGIGLGRGYFRRPAQTADRFVPNPFAAEPGERIYRTGDLARWLPDGNIELIGRIDYQVKLRGLRIECGEIEAAIRRHPAVREAAVVAQADARGDKRLVAYVRPHPPQTYRGNGKAGHNGEPAADDSLAADIRALLAGRLPDYMVPAAIVLVPELPLSPNGKVDRKALAARAVALPQSQDTFVPPRTPEEEVLAGVFAAVLGLDRVGVHEDFFALGGHSLLATQVVSKIRDAFGAELPLRALFEAPTVAGLAERVRAAGRSGPHEQGPPLVAVPRDGRLPLSSAQQALWFLDQLLPGTASYSIPIALRLTGPLDTAALERSLVEIVRRHEALRTVFPASDGEPEQLILPPDWFRVTRVYLSALSEEERAAEVQRRTAEEAARPFDLDRGPLFRTTLVHLAAEDHLLLVTMHHIVSDGWSLDIFVRELAALYGAFAAGRPSPLPPLPLQYADFAAWQRQWLQGKAFDEQAAYWRGQLAGAPPKLEVPADHPRPAVQTLRGARHFFDLPAELVAAAETLGREEGATLFMTLLAAFKALLYAWTGQEDLVVGSPFANRTRTQTEGLIGAFVNTVVLRTPLSGQLTFRQLLRRVREVVLAASAHQELPFEKLVELLRPPRDPSRNPLFQVNFRLQTTPLEVALPGLTTSLRLGDCTHSKFDLALELWAFPQTFRGFFEYSTDLFEPATVTRMCGDLEAAARAALARPDAALDELDALRPIRARRQAPQAAGPQRKKGLRDVSRKGIDLGQ